MKYRIPFGPTLFAALISAAILPLKPAFCQNSMDRTAVREQALTESVTALSRRVQDLGDSVKELRSEVARSQAENDELRKELKEALERLPATGAAAPKNTAQSTSSSYPTAAPIPAETSAGATVPGIPAAARQEGTVSATGGGKDRLSNLEENQQLLESEIKDQHQTKVESASKYRVKLSGIVLMNVFGNGGQTDNADVPSLAFPPGPLDTGGDFGATVRQSELGFQVVGPNFAGARVTADLQMDFFGGFPDTRDGVAFGIARLRTATARLDWANTSLVAGQDAPFFSPLSPHSIASLGVPSLAYSGNLWAWIPQVRVEHRFNITELSRFSVQGGILDPLDGESPASEFDRAPQAGERSRQPGYGMRLEFQHGSAERALALGIGGYYSLQNYGADRTVNAWAGTADLTVPLGHWFTWTGEAYRGRGIGGLGGGVGRSVAANGDLFDPATSIIGLNTIGGWQQLSFKPIEQVEFNAAVGQDNPFAADMRRFASSITSYYTAISRNQTGMFNIIYRPRTDLLFSIEYRHIRTFEIDGDEYTANHVNLSVGVLF